MFLRSSTLIKMFMEVATHAVTGLQKIWKETLIHFPCILNRTVWIVFHFCKKKCAWPIQPNHLGQLHFHPRVHIVLLNSHRGMVSILPSKCNLLDQPIACCLFYYAYCTFSIEISKYDYELIDNEFVYGAEFSMQLPLREVMFNSGAVM
jgi:hypothetical protein